VYHSTQAIVKPQAKTNEAAQKEIEEAMTRQAQNLLNQGLDSNGVF
jgi:splicing factor, arginine/serine-rich 12